MKNVVKQNVVEQLRNFVNDANDLYAKWHSQEFRKASNFDADKHLQRFFEATMDEVRLWNASKYAFDVLALTDVEDLDHFRRGVLRREVSGEITYPKQRDHAAHTLYNYLLGWLLFSKSPVIKANMHAAFKKRGYEKEDFCDEFADVWAYCSLLHDIGYLFEGGLTALSSKRQDDQIRIGAEVGYEFFYHRFWTELGLSSVDDRDTALKLSGVNKMPELASHSMTALAYSLRSLGDLERLRDEIARTMPNESDESPQIRDIKGLPEDAFALWRLNYESFGSKSMCDRVDYMEDVFQTLMQEGFPGSGVRVLDHGICSGLLLLLAATFYFRIAYGIKQHSNHQGKEQSVVKRIKENCKEHGYTPDTWWRLCVWASAATALHNITQKPIKGLRKAPPEPLSIDDDPLAYLGILVDILQEWDRYSISSLSSLIGNGPLQGIDVEASFSDDGILHLAYGSDRAKSVRDDLTTALNDWDKVVSIT